MTNYYKIKVFYFNKYDICDEDKVSMSIYDSEEIIAEKVDNGYREIVTNVFIPERSIIDISQPNSGYSKFFKVYHTQKGITKEIEDKGYIIGTDTKYNPPVLVKKMYEIKEYLDYYDLNKFPKMLHGIQYIKNYKNNNTIENVSVTEENVKKLVKEYEYRSEE